MTAPARPTAHHLSAPSLDTADKKMKMDAYFSVFNLHCNNAGKRADAAFRKKYGVAMFKREIAPKHRAGIMSIFGVGQEMTKHQRVWVQLVMKYVNENRV